MENIEKEKENKLKVLVVEDDETNLILIQRLIKTFDSQIYTARNGLEALALFKNNDIDLFSWISS